MRYINWFLITILGLLFIGCYGTSVIEGSGDDDDTAGDDDSDGDDDTAGDDDDSSSDGPDFSDANGAWLATDGPYLGLHCQTVFNNGECTEEHVIRFVGYGLGGSNDWTYQNGVDAGFDQTYGYVWIDLRTIPLGENDTFRITASTPTDWALYGHLCESSSTAHWMCYENTDGTSWSLAGELDGDVIFEVEAGSMDDYSFSTAPPDQPDTDLDEDAPDDYV